MSTTVFAIGDLHLPARTKPMDIFGPHWADHFARISADWQAKVGPDDLVLIPGDISWAMRLEDALEDLRRIGALPGRKVLLRGNHDYWWSAIGRVRRALPEGMYALQNDCLQLSGVLLAGSRGWTIPADPEGEDEDARIYRRERVRLEMSLRYARQRDPAGDLTVMMHFPPRTDADAGFSDLLEAYGARHVVYGHLHGAGLSGAVRGERNGVTYHQVSCDGLGFQVYRVFEV